MALSESKIKTSKSKDKQYRLSDGGGLALVVHSNGSKYWHLRYRIEGREKTLSLGVYPTTSLAEARLSRDKAKKLISKGLDPKEFNEHKNHSEQITFEIVAKKWCESNKKWSENHRAKVLRTLELYLFPKIGNYALFDLTAQEITKHIKIIEESGRYELASRLLQRATSIMRYSVQNGYIVYNPAQDLKGVVSRVKVTHRPALDLNAIPDLIERIEEFKGKLITKLAIKLSLLVFIRSSELRLARWSEIDFKKRIWTIPAERKAIDGVKFSERGAKMKTPHLVPLSHQAISVLKQIQKISGNYDLVLIGDQSPNKPMSENTINKALRLMGYDTKTQLCGHGFRTMACSALVESSLWSRDAIERQMSHMERNGVRAAYIHKAAHIIERAEMMQWWANYLDTIKQEFVMPYEFKVA